MTFLDGTYLLPEIKTNWHGFLPLRQPTQSSLMMMILPLSLLSGLHFSPALELRCRTRARVRIRAQTRTRGMMMNQFSGLRCRTPDSGSNPGSNSSSTNDDSYSGSRNDDESILGSSLSNTDSSSNPGSNSSSTNEAAAADDENDGGGENFSKWLFLSCMLNVFVLVSFGVLHLIIFFFYKYNQKKSNSPALGGHPRSQTKGIP
eukprot:FR741009.1.p2 GENE.FR741009.1~~FR741009.1.p2  ORF type:complete len:204 (+),score=27.50 FR741009.1:182-793(+)